MSVQTLQIRKITVILSYLLLGGITGCSSTQSSVTVVNTQYPNGAVNSSYTSVYRNNYSRVENFINNNAPPVYYQPGYYPTGYNSWGYYQTINYTPGFYQSGFYYSN